MFTRPLYRTLFSAALFALPLLVFLCPAAMGEFVLVDDFTDLDLGPIGGQGGWVAPSENSAVVGDPLGIDNQVLSVITESTYLYREASLPNGLSRMLFFRFRFDSQLNFSMGMSDVGSPTRFDHFEVELGLVNSEPELRINDGGNYDFLSILDEHVWYSCWILIDNENDQTQVWLHRRGYDDACEEDQLESADQEVFAFRNSESDHDLLNFFIKTGGGNGVSGPLYIDDIYLENTNAVNLDHPVGWAAALGDESPLTRLELDVLPSIRAAGVTPISIRYVLPHDDKVQLALFDVTGQRLAQWSVMASAGSHVHTWDGSLGEGRALSDGVYFWQLSTSAGNVATKQILTR